MMSNRKSDTVDRCIFIWRTFLPNFIPIRFETTELWDFWRQSPQEEEKQKNNSNNKMSSDYEISSC